MNESTLVPREEMSDLDWLARNVHVWVPNELLRMKPCDNGNGTFRASWCYSGDGGFTKAQWLALRAELQNKPSWNDAPEWANWMAQSPRGHWEFFSAKPRATYLWMYSVGERSSANDIATPGVILGDWRDTLESRPSDPSEKAVTARLKEATDNVIAAAPELMAEKYKFEPFVSVEDAATARQPAPKGSGSPILGMVLADLTNRALEGKEKYGEPLLAHNGRNPLWDAYQEALDLAMYLRQAIEEQK